LREADLLGADLREANLLEADLRRADLQGAKLHGAFFIHSELLKGAIINENTKLPAYLEHNRDELLESSMKAPPRHIKDD
jgi:uncharacterized protein YjbI with pentapeptide repeats